VEQTSFEIPQTLNIPQYFTLSMKILALHSDYINIEAKKKALKDAEEIKEKTLSEKECLVVLTAVEKIDENNTDFVSKQLVNEIKDISKQVKTKNIVLYPYVHLSNSPSSPKIALEILKKAENLLKKTFKIKRAPFGWYKMFEIKVKGHPLSELSREIRAEGKETKYDYKKLLKEISKSRLDRTKLKDNDHRILGQQMDLFSFNEVAPGMVFWHNNGLIIRNALIDFWGEVHKQAGYQEIKTPQVLDRRLWQISGHWEKFKENMFLTDYEKRDFAVKPMNCPGGMLVYKNSPKSYKDLPLKMGEMGEVHRIELSGTLGGLFRVIQFTQDDAHIFCNEKQMETEVSNALDLLSFIYGVFNFKVNHVELSTRPKRRIGTEKQWDRAEKVLEKVLKKKKMKFKINKGDGAFYGPKIDFHVKDSLNRTWQCGTFQLDFAMPERFDLKYIDKDNSHKRPVMIHRTIYGSVERFLGVLIEHTNGWLPTWLAPIQIRIISFTDRNKKYTETIANKLKKEIPGLRIDTDFRTESVSLKIKEAIGMKIPYTIVIGDKEEKTKKLPVRKGGKKDIKSMALNSFAKSLKGEILNRK